MVYNEDDYLMISGIQHFLFCKRQWALIHIEQVWHENVLTIEGKYLHEKADQPMIREKRKGHLVVRGMPLHSREVGITGICDVVEFLPDDEHGVPISGETGRFVPYPVEYKHGQPKKDLSDTMQLVAQAICLEEMISCEVKEGAVFYDKIKQREKIIIIDDLKNQCKKNFAEMHGYFSKGYTPKVKTGNFCQKCSIKDDCVPRLMKKESVKNYLQRRLRE